MSVAERPSRLVLERVLAGEGNEAECRRVALYSDTDKGGQKLAAMMAEAEWLAAQDDGQFLRSLRRAAVPKPSRAFFGGWSLRLSLAAACVLVVGVVVSRRGSDAAGILAKGGSSGSVRIFVAGASEGLWPAGTPLRDGAAFRLVYDATAPLYIVAAVVSERESPRVQWLIDAETPRPAATGGVIDGAWRIAASPGGSQALLVFWSTSRMDVTWLSAVAERGSVPDDFPYGSATYPILSLRQHE